MKTSNRAGSDQTMRARDLLAREVRDTGGKRLGRVYDLWAEREGDTLRVAALVVGAHSWPVRFGWKSHSNGNRIPWEHVVSLSPHVVVQSAETLENSR